MLPDPTIGLDRPQWSFAVLLGEPSPPEPRILWEIGGIASLTTDGGCGPLLEISQTQNTYLEAGGAS